MEHMITSLVTDRYTTLTAVLSSHPRGTRNVQMTSCGTRVIKRQAQIKLLAYPYTLPMAQTSGCQHPFTKKMKIM